MKALNTIKIIPLTIMIFTIAAGTGYGRTFKERSLRAQEKAVHRTIDGTLWFPLQGFEKNLNGEVELIFDLTSEGRIAMKGVASENAELTNYVKDQLAGITMKSNVQFLDQACRMKIKFRPG